MEVKEAVAAAKKYVADLFADEKIEHIGLEEVEFDGRFWLVTIGFSRPWQRSALTAAMGHPMERDYKILRISDAKQEVLSVKDRMQAS